MLRRIAGPLALLFATCLATAQGEVPVKISFASEGEREVWVQKEGSADSLPDTTKVSGKAVEIDVTTDSKGLSVFVRDVATGNVAVRLLEDVIRDGSWNVLVSHETHTYAVSFLVQHDDLPVASANLTLTIEAVARHQLVTPADHGVVTFYIVPLGDFEVSVDYKSDGENRSLGAQVFEAKLEMADQAPYVLTIDDDVETVAPPPELATGDGEADDGEAEDGEEEEAPPKNIGIIIAQMLMGLIVIGGISYGIWRMVKANPEGTEDLLTKAGVPMGGDPGSGGPGAVPHKKPGPPEQIILGGAQPPAASTPTSAAPVGAAAVKNPRLVKADGSVFMVMDGENTVGREAGLQLSIEGESSISRNHAQLARSDDTVVVKDLGSTNGTYVNGAKITSEVTLSPGDTVQFGAVQYRYEE